MYGSSDRSSTQVVGHAQSALRRQLENSRAPVAVQPLSGIKVPPVLLPPEVVPELDAPVLPEPVELPALLPAEEEPVDEPAVLLEAVVVPVAVPPVVVSGAVPELQPKPRNSPKPAINEDLNVSIHLSCLE
jgi:hypothetical protein